MRRRYPQNDDWESAAIRLVPTVKQKAQLDETWLRMVALMARVDHIMRETGLVTFWGNHKAYVEALRELPESAGLSQAQLQSCVRTVSRYRTSDPHADYDWSQADSVVISARVARLRATYDCVGIQTCRERIAVSCVPLYGEPIVFRRPQSVYHWSRLGPGDYAILYLPNEYERSIQRRTERAERLRAGIQSRSGKPLNRQEKTDKPLHPSPGVTAEPDLNAETLVGGHMSRIQNPTAGEHLGLGGTRPCLSG